MNHNILKIIIDKVSWLQWHQKIIDINNEYHHYFYADYMGIIYLNINNCSCIVPSFRYNFRKYIKCGIYNHNIGVCSNGNIHPISRDLQLDLPRNY